MINASFVFGLDDDDPSTFRRTAEWIMKQKIETVTSHILTPYPGTEQYRRMEESGQITDYDQRHYTTSNVVYARSRMTAEQLRQGYLLIYREIYSWKGIFRRMPRHQKAGYLLFNILYRKYGGLTSRVCRLVGFNNIGRICENLSFFPFGRRKQSYFADIDNKRIGENVLLE